MRTQKLLFLVLLFLASLSHAKEPKAVLLTDEEKVLLAKLDVEEQAYVKWMVEHNFVAGDIDYNSCSKGDVGRISGTSSDGCHVNQIVDGSNMLIYGNGIWLEGVETSSIREGATLSLESLRRLVLYSAGNKPYSTVLGSTKSPLHLIVANTNRSEDLLSKIADRIGMHLFRDSNGRALGVGEFKRKNIGKVYVKLRDGRSTFVLYDQLSEADKKWVDSQK